MKKKIHPQPLFRMNYFIIVRNINYEENDLPYTRSFLVNRTTRDKKIKYIKDKANDGEYEDVEYRGGDEYQVIKGKYKLPSDSYRIYHFKIIIKKIT